MFFSALSFFQNHMQHLFWSVLLLLTVLGKGSCMLQEAEITVFCTQSDCGQFIWALTFSLPLEYRMTSEEDCFLFAYLMSCNITLEFRLFCIWTEPYFFFFFFRGGRQFYEEIRTCCTNSFAGKGLKASGSVYFDFFLFHYSWLSAGHFQISLQQVCSAGSSCGEWISWIIFTLLFCSLLKGITQIVVC